MLLFPAVDLNWLLQFIVTLFLVGFGLLHILRNTASKYFLAAADENGNGSCSSGDSNYTDVSEWSSSSSSSSSSTDMMTIKTMGDGYGCAVCGNPTKKRCSGCRMFMYCSQECQRSHWRQEHKSKCKDFQLLGKSAFGCGKAYTGTGSPNSIQSKEVLFPYEEFLNFFNWDRLSFRPHGLENCGNSCFANVVLQCLAFTKPLAAFLLEKGHRGTCRRNAWCFFCEFEIHIGRTIRISRPFSPINILSRLPNIGGNLGYGKQEDAHEFMRFAIDTMQSVCLDEFGGEKAVHPSSRKTTLIQHIFGGHLQSQVICANCENVSDQLENMMDLTVEIQGNACSLEQCLDQFTKREWLHGDNMYKCDGCNKYVTASKRLTVRQGPNILTIALKRFQTGNFGKLNKKISFPETLDLSPYMSESGDNNNVYKLYAVIVHIDMLNTSYCGHYICYIKDFCGGWYCIDDDKVQPVDIDEVLSQKAYMVLYSRKFARQSSLYPGRGEKGETTAKVPNQCQPIEMSKDALAGAGPNQCQPIEVSSDAHAGADCTLEDISMEVSNDALAWSDNTLQEISSVRNPVDGPNQCQPIEVSNDAQVGVDSTLEKISLATNHADGTNQCQSIELSNDALAGAGSAVEEISLIRNPREGSNQCQPEMSNDALAGADCILGGVCVANNSADEKEGFEQEENAPVDVDICGESSVSVGNGDLVNHSLEIERSSDVNVLEIECPVSYSSEVGHVNGSSIEITPECSTDSKSVPTQNHVDEKEQTSVDFSAVPNSQVEIKSANNCLEKKGNTEHSIVRRSSRQHSRGNSKPIFARGFLDRHSLNKPAKVNQKLCNGSIGNGRNGIVSPGISSGHSNGGSVRNNNSAES